jgi:hypothetical protein
MPRPSVSLDVQRRLFEVARDVSDETGNLSHEEALKTVLDYVESNDGPDVETMEELLQQRGEQQDDPFGGTGVGVGRQQDSGGWRTR